MCIHNFIQGDKKATDSLEKIVECGQTNWRFNTPPVDAILSARSRLDNRPTIKNVRSRSKDELDLTDLAQGKFLQKARTIFFTRLEQQIFKNRCSVYSWLLVDWYPRSLGTGEDVKQQAMVNGSVLKHPPLSNAVSSLRRPETSPWIIQHGVRICVTVL